LFDNEEGLIEDRCKCLIPHLLPGGNDNGKEVITVPCRARSDLSFSNVSYSGLTGVSSALATGLDYPIKSGNDTLNVYIFDNNRR
jgi:hypothetical protein